MKKYLVSALAVVIVLIAFSFTVKDNKRQTTYDFRFSGSVTSESDIDNEQSNWAVFTGSSLCDPNNNKACEILDIPESYTELVNNVRKMKTTVDIQTSVSSGTNRYVSSTAPTTDVIVNKD